MKIGNKVIGESTPCFIIAEIGINHDGNVDKAKELIDLAVNCQADAVKFQSFIPKDLYSSKACPEGIELLNQFKLTFDEQKDLFHYAQRKNIIFLSTPFEFKSARMLYDLGVDVFKIASGEINYFEFLEYIAKFKKPMIISSGSSYLTEIEKATSTVFKTGNKDVALLHCVSAYPAPDEALNLNVLKTLQLAFPECIIGYSDHSIGIEAAIIATTLGAKIIEKHFTYDRKANGPDHQASADPQEFAAMVKAIRRTEQMLGSTTKQKQVTEIQCTRSLTIIRNIQKGETIETKDIIACRPSGGIPPDLKTVFVGRKAARKIEKDELATLDMI